MEPPLIFDTLFLLVETAFEIGGPEELARTPTVLFPFAFMVVVDEFLR